MRMPQLPASPAYRWGGAHENITMAQKPPGRNRPVNVAVRPFLPELIERLLRATRWDPAECKAVEDGIVKPGSYQGEWCVDNPDRFAVSYLWGELLSKFDDKKPSAEKEDRTWARFFEAEDACARTNERLIYKDPCHFSTSDKGVWSLIESAKRKISYILGDLDLNEAHKHMTFTGGASTRLKRRIGHSAYKYSGIPETTFDNLDFATAAICTVPLWEERLRLQGNAGLCNVVPGNKIECVPKNYKQHRPIAKEPCMNMYVQKGFGTLIRRRLRRVGIDLSTQQTNQDLAHLGSVTGAFATVDLSMASDTISLELVRLLLPTAWLTALEMCRSTQGVLPSGKKVYYRKFSSMGNGYTFELETLIFLGLALATCETYGVSSALVAVYGDDIVVPSAVATPFMDLLRFCGFTPNEKKTFVDGDFRESCGKHFLRGNDVTPFYIKEDPRTLTDLFKVHNKLKRWVQRQSWNTYVDQQQLQDILFWLRSLAPSNWRRPRIPNGYGDGAFYGSFDECLPSKPANTYVPGKIGARDGWEGWLVEVIADVATELTYDGDGLARRVRKNKDEWDYRPVDSQESPEPVGWLLDQLSVTRDCPLSYLDDPRGGLSLGPRARVVQTLVSHFA